MLFLNKHIIFVVFIVGPLGYNFDAMLVFLEVISLGCYYFMPVSMGLW